MADPLMEPGGLFSQQIHTALLDTRFGGDSCQLTAEELSMYDFIIGASNMMEMGFYMPKTNDDLRRGLDWFRKNNAEAYMILLD